MTNRPRRRHRVLHNRYLVGDLSKQAHSTAHDVVKVHRPSHECLNGSSLRRRERLESSDAVDEEAVPLVRRDAPGAGVGVGNVPLLL